ncbi:MAG: SGNH/GDSL hydrolase family protein [Acidimicrobiia bacterium]|nr:SGNH/GDSL hydrolase family protein [Acidimicrobiia bacterium]
MRAAAANVSRGRGRLARRAVVVLLSAVALLGFSACEPRPSYVSLGDSFTAGPLIPEQRRDPAGCLRSTNNYPSLVKPDLDVPAFRDPSCSGAKTTHMKNAQDVDPGPNPPQFDKLDKNTSVVSIGIGGNDIGFSSIAKDCASLKNEGTPCQDKYVVNGVDEIARRIDETGPKVANVLQGIHNRSPNAKVFVVGYPAILPASGPGCHPVVPVTDGDVPYLRGIQLKLNAMLNAQAQSNAATYVDTYTPSIGHDACQLPGTKWVEPPAPTSPAAPLHPNIDGMRGMARVVLATMRANGVE